MVKFVTDIKKSSIYERIQNTIHNDIELRRIFANSGWLLGSNSFGLILSLVQSVFTTRILGVEQYGILGIIAAFVGTINQVTAFRMNEFVVKFVGDSLATNRPQHAALYIKLALLVEVIASILAFFMVVILAPLGATWLIKNPQLTQLIVFYGIVLLGNIVAETSKGILQVFDKFYLIAVSNIIRTTCSLVGTIIIFWYGGDLWEIMLVLLLSNFFEAIFILSCATNTVNLNLKFAWWREPFSLLKPEFRRISSFIFSTNLSATISLITKESDLLWLGYFQNPVQVGYYKLATSLAKLAFFPTSPLTQTIYPQINATVAQRDWQKARRLIRNSSTVVAGYTIPLVAITAFFGTPLIRLIYGADYLPASKALIILIIGMSFANTFFWTRPTLLSLDQEGYLVSLGIATATIKILGIFIFVPTWGYIGCALLLLLLYFIGVGASIFRCSRLIPG